MRILYRGNNNSVTNLHCDKNKDSGMIFGLTIILFFSVAFVLIAIGIRLEAEYKEAVKENQLIQEREIKTVEMASDFL